MERIALVTDAWHPQINGVVTTLSRTVQYLRDAGHEVKTITPEWFRSVPCPSYNEISLALAGPGKVGRELENFSPTCVHIATEGPLGWAARAVCRKKKFAFSTSYHTRFPEYVRMRWPVPLALSYTVIRNFHQAAARTMVGTRTLMDELDRRGFKNLVRWSRGVDTNLFKPLPNRLDSLQQVKNLQRPTFIYVGRVAVEKNIEAFLALELPGSKVVVGDGPARQELEKRYPEVHFTGYLKGKALVDVLAHCDVFVFPSLTDTFGVVILEAMAAGLPVAAYPVTGPLESVQNGVNGWLDSDLRRAALRALEVSPGKCREYALQHTWESCCAQFENNLVFQQAMCH